MLGLNIQLSKLTCSVMWTSARFESKKETVLREDIWTKNRVTSNLSNLKLSI